MAIAPWLMPTDVIGSMSRGAQLGLEERRQAVSESEAADRLKMAYEQMALEERRSSELQKYRADQAAMALIQKQQQADMLNEYRKGELQARGAAQALQAQHFDELKRHNIAMEGKPRLHNVPGVGLVQEDADGNVDVVMPSKDKAETERQKDASILSAAKVLGGDPNTPGFPIASNAAWNILSRYNALPKPTTETPEPESPSRLPGMLLGAASGAAGSALGPMLGAALGGGSRSLPAAPTEGVKRVRVKSPDGKVGTIPSDQLDDALAAGYEKAE